MRALVGATCIYCLLSNIHAAFTLAEMAWFFARTKQTPPAWMFPPLFGHKLSMNLASRSQASTANVSSD
jgi:hypothetical protein